MNRLPMRLILDNIRSTGNVGAILRTADAAGVESVSACGYTPYPRHPGDTRPPHVADSNTRAISKTALGAEATMLIRHFPDTVSAVLAARSDGYAIIVIEQAENSLKLYQYQPFRPMAIVLGNEVEGVNPEVMTMADAVLELPMIGHKESLNVAVATGIALYQLRFGV